MPLAAPANRTSPGGLTSPIQYLSAAIYDPFVLHDRDGGSGRLPDGPQLTRVPQLIS